MPVISGICSPPSSLGELRRGESAGPVDVFPERGPAQLVPTAAVARRYYVDDASKVDIAEYGLGRSQVARLPDRWHDRAPVRTRWSPARLHTVTTTVGSRPRRVQSAPGAAVAAHGWPRTRRPHRFPGENSVRASIDLASADVAPMALPWGPPVPGQVRPQSPRDRGSRSQAPPGPRRAPHGARPSSAVVRTP
jgi:hypothetical protein